MPFSTTNYTYIKIHNKYNKISHISSIYYKYSLYSSNNKKSKNYSYNICLYYKK